jgi:hypothetical protein
VRKTGQIAKICSIGLGIFENFVQAV